jgi:hypothetical protein
MTDADAAWPDFTAARLPGHRFVATAGGQVTGWVATSPVSGRRRDVVPVERRSPVV